MLTKSRKNLISRLILPIHPKRSAFLRGLISSLFVLFSVSLLLSSCFAGNIIPIIDNVHFKEIRLDNNKIIAYISLDVYNKSSRSYDIQLDELNVSQSETIIAFIDAAQTYHIEKESKNVLTIPLHFNQDAIVLNIFQFLQSQSLKLSVEGKGKALFKKRSQTYSFNEEIELKLDMFKEFLFKK